MQVNLDEVQGIFAEDNAQLKTLLEKYSVDSVERCARWLFIILKVFTLNWKFYNDDFLKMRLLHWPPVLNSPHPDQGPSTSEDQLDPNLHSCDRRLHRRCRLHRHHHPLLPLLKVRFWNHLREWHFECLAGIRGGSDEATSRSWRLQWGRLSLPHCHQVLIRFFPSADQIYHDYDGSGSIMGPPAPSLMGGAAYGQGGPSVTGSNGR